MRYILILLCLWCPVFAVAGGNIEEEEYPESAVIEPGPFREADARFISAFCRDGLEGMAESVLKCYGEKDKNTRAANTCLAGDVMLSRMISLIVEDKGAPVEFDNRAFDYGEFDKRIDEVLKRPAYAAFRGVHVNNQTSQTDDDLHLLYYIAAGLKQYSALWREDEDVSLEAIQQYCNRYAEHPATDRQ